LAWQRPDRLESRPIPPKIKSKETRVIQSADIVIIGAGSAGCVLAARLSENPSLNVLLLEAGSREASFLGNIPGMTMRLMGNPITDWNHPGRPDPSANARSLIWHGGKMLGGGSSINGMVYIRGLQRDYDEWDCEGWAWRDVEPYFRRAEQFEDDTLPSLGKAGPLSVSRIRSVHPLSGKFVEACAELGLETLPDYNAGSGEGAYLGLASQKRGQRASTAMAYLRPAATRPNLHILRGALVDKILFENKHANGIRIEHAGATHDIRVNREVILSAGTIQSPVILLRSGVGPAEALRAQGITAIADSPEVGANLQDHVGFIIAKFVNMPTYNSEMGPVSGLRHVANYLLFRRGPLASPVVQAMAWARSHASAPAPDIQLNFLPYGIDFNASPPAMHKRPCVSLGANISRPHTRGRIGLSGPAAQDRPAIEYQELGDERDMATMLHSVALLENLYRTRAFAPAVLGPVPPFDAPRTDPDLPGILRQVCGLGLHSVGTCRMGLDASAVVDLQLRVRGVSGLRVIDASIMPRLVSANTNAAAIMIGEKGADQVKRAIQNF
jgi:choline dehydrogenase